MLASAYTTTVTDANGCLVSLGFEVSEPDLLEASVSVTDPLCNGDLGSAELVVTGGTAPYEIDDLSDLLAGSYNTVVTDNNGCEVSVDFDVIEPDPIEVAITTEDVSCNGESNGSASLDITGGTGDYNYEVQIETQVAQENNYSMSFDGIDDYVDLGLFCDYNLCYDYQSFSINLKVKVDEFGYNNGGQEGVIIGTYDTDANYNGFNLHANPDNKFIFQVGGNGNNVYAISQIKEVNTWYDVTIVLDQLNDLMQIYIDGVLEDQASISNIGTISNNYSMYLGGAIVYSTNYFSGTIDDLSIWTNALEDSNISELSCNFLTGSEEGLANFWNFENEMNDAEVYGANYSSDVFLNEDCTVSESVFIDDLDNLSAGDYVITTFDTNGCFDVTEFSISEPEEILLTFDSTPGEYSNCSSGTAEVFVEGGVGPYNYQWSNGVIASDITGLCGGEYSVTVTDANGCVVEGMVVVDYLVPEGWEVIESGMNHIINIPSDVIMLLDQEDLTPGDYLGVFDFGGAFCYGYVMWLGESTQVVANIVSMDVYSQMQWKVWDNETETEAHGFAVYDDSYPDERYYNVDGESGLLGAIFASHQIIPLNESSYSDWDMISTYMSTDEDMSSLLSPVSNELIIIKDANGLVYWPALAIASLNNMNTEDAYAIKTYASNELVVNGEFMQPESMPFMLSGWNYISYPRYFPLDPEVGLSDIDGNIKLLKDDSGNLYWPELGINSIGEMEAGEGYILKVLSDQEFTYPSNSDHVNAIDGNTSAGRIGLTQSTYYTDLQKTNSNMVIGFPLESWIDFDVQYGDELAVFDAEGNIVGATVLNDDNNVVVVWGDDLASDTKDGMVNGEEFTIELWKQSSDQVFSIDVDWDEGVDYFSVNGINIAAQVRVVNKLNDQLTNLYCYPNPSSGYFNVEFYLNTDDIIDITVFNIIGEKVHSMSPSSFNKGLNNVPFDLSYLSQGLYYLEINSTLFSKTLSIDINK